MNTAIATGIADFHIPGHWMQANTGNPGHEQ
jgi:hypothetical protein